MIKINMGCGKRNFGSDWVHIDAAKFDHVDHYSIEKLDFFEESTVDLIYASHVLSYFDREEIKLLLNEWFRVLKPGGVLRLAVPDFSSMSRLYCDGLIGLNQIIGPLYGRMKVNDSFIYHKTVYDFVELKKILEDNGFTNVQKYDWRLTDHSEFDDHSQAYLPHMDKENGTLISLNIECVK